MKSVFSSGERQSEERREDELVLLRTLRFTYHHVISLVAVSLAWTLLSLPLVTLGPATLGAYRAIRSLRETDTVEIGEVLSTVRSNFFASLLFGLLPLLFVGIGLLYATAAPGNSSSVSLLIAVVSLYLGAYLGVLLVPTFHGIAEGAAPVDAIRDGYVWTAGNPTTAVRLVLVTVAFFLFSLLLTVAVVAIFPAFIMSYHALLVESEFSK